MDYQHRYWVEVITSYPKKVEKTSIKRQCLELRCAEPLWVTMLVPHTTSLATTFTEVINRIWYDTL